MKKLTAIILSVCLGAAGLTGCQAGASETPAASSRAADTSRQQAEKGPKEETKSREDSAGEPDASQSGGTVIITDHAGSQVEIPQGSEPCGGNGYPSPSLHAKPIHSRRDDPRS